METTLIPVTKENYGDAAEGLYWFCVHYHAGQYSTLYRVQCQLEFHPGPCSNGPETDSEAQDIYDILSDLANENYTAAENEAERLLSEIQKAYDSVHE